MSELQKLVQKVSREQERQQLEMERMSARHAAEQEILRANLLECQSCHTDFQRRLHELLGKLENILGFPVSLTATVKDEFERVWDFILRLEKGLESMRLAKCEAADQPALADLSANKGQPNPSERSNNVDAFSPAIASFQRSRHATEGASGSTPRNVYAVMASMDSPPVSSSPLLNSPSEVQASVDRAAASALKLEPTNLPHQRGSLDSGQWQPERTPTPVEPQSRVEVFPSDRQGGIVSAPIPSTPVNLIRSEGFLSGSFDPSHISNLCGAANLLLKDIIAPKFLGASHDWPRFQMEWNDYVSLLREAYPGISDKILLGVLSKNLDQTSRNLLERLTHDTPDLKYKTSWSILDTEFGRDTTHVHREAWFRVPLTVKG